MDIEKEIKNLAPKFAKDIRDATNRSRNEAELRTKLARLIDEIAVQIDLKLNLYEEYTLINGRADAVYNRLIIEYEPPKCFRSSNNYRTNKHAIDQLQTYIKGLVKKERHKPERVAGVALDGEYFIFVRFKEGAWRIDEPLKVENYTAERFLKMLSSLSTELALIPENLIRDFGENTAVSRHCMKNLFRTLNLSASPKVQALFKQWSLQFSEVCDYEETSKLKIETFAKKFAIEGSRVEPFQFFFCLHTYYACFIKLLAILVVQFYAMPRFGTNLKKVATFEKIELLNYLRNIEDGGIFRQLGISNFIEGDLFSWYLEAWDDELYQAFKNLISNLANYSLVTLDVDPETTRDLLKKLYQQLMPKELRHNLGEYYTPDWIAERLLNMLEAGNFKGDPDKRILDPACGSGTFLVLAIQKIRNYGWQKDIPEAQLLEKILKNVVGFDLNPLAAISARTNYLLALGDLLEHRPGEQITVPIYLCDSILTPSEGKDLLTSGIFRFNTTVGPFELPKSLIQAQYINDLADFLENAVKLNFDKSQFIEQFCKKFPLLPDQDRKDIEVVYKLYEKLISLEKQKVNGIWARIIKNAFAPLFAGEFDYVAGNPPWINWESLPEVYREETKYLWLHYGMAATKGKGKDQFELGKQKRDISALMTYVSADKYLKKGGKLGFVITQSVFKTNASSSFRNFLLPENVPLQVYHVDDMVELNPFEGASNRTSVFVLQKGRATKYPMPSYLYWKKAAKGKAIPLEASLEETIGLTERKQFVAEPVDEKDTTSSWLTGRPKALKAVRKILGKSDYTAHAGVCGWANSIYWVDIVDKRSEEVVLISNITEGAKRKIESIQAQIETSLLYPLLRPRDLTRWKAEPSANIILPHTPETEWQAITEQEMKSNYEKTYLYFKRFEEVLKNRSGYKLLRKGHPFYILVDIHKETFSPFKVVWTRVAKIEAAVVGEKEGKAIIPQETISLVALNSRKEAYYLAAMINSAPFQYAAVSYSQEGGKSMGSPHVLENIRIPKFDSQSKSHQKLSELSEQAHKFAKSDKQEKVTDIEEQIDQLSGEIWGLTKEELKEIMVSLKELE